MTSVAGISFLLEMGNCIKTERATNTASECLSHANTESITIDSPIQGSSASSQLHTSEISVIKLQESSFREPSSKDEVFYDTNLSIDSDCEDFYSANGDTTPSLDETSIGKSRAGETAQPDKSIHIDDSTDSQREPSSNKLLIEFLDRDSFNNDDNQISVQEPDQQANFPAKSANKGSFVSLVNRVRRGKKTQNKTHSNPTNTNGRRPAKSCLPNLVQSLSFSQKKKALDTA